MELIITSIIIVTMIVLFMTNALRVDFVALLALLALTIFGILTVDEALSGFSNSVVMMLAALFVVGAGILRTGLAQIASDFLLQYAGKNDKLLFITLMLIVAVVGSFMSNTGTVAIMLPIVVTIALQIGDSPSKYLLPLSYVASFSGLLTIIASPANLIASQTLEANGFEPLTFFKMTPVGITGVIVGITYLYFIRHRLVKDTSQTGITKNGYQLSPARLAQEYDLRDNLTRVSVPAHSEIVGQGLPDLKLPNRYHVCLLKIQRQSNEGINLLPITYQEMASADTVIHENDELYVQGTFEQVEQFAADYELTIEEEESEAKELVTKELGIAEVLLTPKSRLIDRTIREIGFREKYNVNILGINRQGKYVMEEITKEKLKFGDALLVQGSWESIERLTNETKDVVVIGQPKEYAGKASASGKAPVAGAILALMIGLLVFDVFPAVVSISIAAALMILTGCLRNIGDAYREINWETVILIGAMFPIATALEKTGGMEILSGAIIDIVGPYGPLGVLAGLYLMTMAFGQVISNTATAVLFAPIAINAAMLIGADPVSFLIAVAVGANMSFVTPVASPTNALVMTAGGYEFKDFVKAGIPLQLIMFVVLMIILPIFYPF
ncbi:MAG TPA: SLC13 family permease [Savagea sp.]